MARATTKKTVAERIISNKKDIKTSFAMGRRIKSGVSSASSIGSGQGSGGAVDLSGHFLETAGGTMIGPIAFLPQPIAVLSDAIDISINAGNYSSCVIATGQGGVADNLSKIIGAGFSGQVLIIQAAATTPITLKDIATPGNIHLPGGTDVLIPALDAVTLIFDSTQASGGRWILSAGSGGGSGDNLGNHIATQTLDMNEFDIIHSRELTFSTTSDAIIINTEAAIGYIPSTSRMVFNIPSLKTYEWRVNAENIMSLARIGVNEGLLTIVELDPKQINFVNSALDPTVNGQMRLNGPDLKVWSGGALRNLSDISAGGGNEFADNVFRVYDNLDSTSKIQFNLDGMTTGFTSELRFLDTAPRVYQFPNANTTLAGWEVANFFSVFQTFLADVDMSGNVTLGSAASDNITFNGDTVGHITPNADNVYDLGGAGQRFRSLYLSDTANLNIVAGPVTYTGNATFTGSIHVINSPSIVIGDGISDNVSIQAQVTSNFVPDVNNSFDLGTSALRWNDIFLGGAINHASGGTIGFYGNTPRTIPATTYALGGDSLLTLIGRFNTLMGALDQGASGVGLVNAT